MPAVQKLDGLELAAIATSSQETADEAAHVFGVAKAYGDGAALIADGGIDLVTVATRVPDHRALVLAAIAASKHVYCEWPLGRSCAESGETAGAARAAGVHHAIGLQLRASPAVVEARRLLAAGEIGRLLSISAFSSTVGFGAEVPESLAYLEDPASFANLITIQGAHTLELVAILGGTPTILPALISRQFPAISVGDRHEPRRRETFDHFLVQGRVDGGAPFTIEVARGRKVASPFAVEIVGENGTLKLDGSAPRGPQSGRITLVRDGQRVSVDEGELAAMPDPAVNVAGVYATLRDDILHDTWTVQGFDRAETLAHMIEAVLGSANESRAIPSRWPA